MTNSLRQRLASVMTTTILLTVVSAIVVARNAHANPECIHFLGIELCSATTNLSSEPIVVERNWCGDDEWSLNTCGENDPESDYDLLLPGESTFAHQDWDAFYIPMNAKYTGEIYFMSDPLTTFTLFGGAGGGWQRVHSGENFKITGISYYTIIPADAPLPNGPITPDDSNPHAASRLAFQANTGFLYTREPDGTMRDTRYGMMLGTSPATSNGQVVFQANTGFLFTMSTAGAMHDTRLGMMAGTSPAVSGGQIAFQANTSLLFTRNMSTGATTDLRLGMMAGTSPSIAGDTGSWRIAFQANTGFLYYRDSGGATVNTGFGMMAGTSPSITKLSDGRYVTAFQANTGMLWVLDNNGHGTDLSLGMMAGTSPSISASGTAWTIAFQANTSFLFTRSSSGATVDTRYGMMAHTSPSIRGSRIVFQANNGFLYLRDGTSAAVNTEYGMMTGTNPAD